jgi:hypothetical protein
MEKHEALEPVDDRKTYPMATFMRMVGWGRHALKQAGDKGLRVVRVSGRCFIRGRDFSDWLGKLGPDGVATPDSGQTSAAG